MKKVLIITYYWPPAGGPGVQRWLKFVKYLPDYNIQPIVYIPDNPTYPILDPELVDEVPLQAIILKKRIFEPYGLASIFSKNNLKKMSSGIIPSERKQTFTEKLALWIRGNVFIPDARVYWVKPSVSYLESYIKSNEIDTIITSGPPHSLHLIGLELKRKLDLKWLADFRDPWTTIGYHKALKLSARSDEKHNKMEMAVLNSADLILVTSKSTKAEFSLKTSKPIEVITNGFDGVQKSEVVLDSKFSIAHIGSLLSQRNPIILWSVLADLLREVSGFSDHLELKLIGTISQEVVNAIITYNLRDFTNVIGYVSHASAIEHQRKSQVLLLIEINSPETMSIIPGKIFEYINSGRPTIAIGPMGSDFAEIIDETNTGIFVNYSEKEKLKEAIKGYYDLYLQGKLKCDAVNTDQYSRKNLTGKLANLLQ